MICYRLCAYPATADFKVADKVDFYQAGKVGLKCFLAVIKTPWSIEIMIIIVSNIVNHDGGKMSRTVYIRVEL